MALGTTRAGSLASSAILGRGEGMALGSCQALLPVVLDGKKRGEDLPGGAVGVGHDPGWSEATEEKSKVWWSPAG